MRLNSRLLLVTALLAAPAVVAGFASTGEGLASFQVNGTGGLTIVGKTKAIAVTDDDTAVTVTVTLTDVATGIAVRDNHTRKYLEVEKFPTTTLVVKKADLAIPAAAGPLKGSATGTYTLHGVTKEKVPFTYTGTCTEAGCTVEGTLNLNMNDYGITVKKYLGIGVKPDVVVTSTFAVKR